MRELGIEGAVTFLGRISQTALFEEMAKAEVFLFMSRYPPERLPNVVKEAIACRCLYVVSKTPGIEELVNPGKHAFVVDLLDIEEGASSAVQALLRIQKREVMAPNAFSHLREDFSIDGIVAQYLFAWNYVSLKIAGKVR